LNYYTPKTNKINHPYYDSLGLGTAKIRLLSLMMKQDKHCLKSMNFKMSWNKSFSNKKRRHTIYCRETMTNVSKRLSGLRRCNTAIMCHVEGRGSWTGINLVPQRAGACPSLSELLQGLRQITLSMTGSHTWVY
jgi:hypothetical protein